MKYLKKQPHDERGYFGDHRRASKGKREDWEYICGVIFPKDPPSEVSVADSDVKHLDPEMLTFFLLWQGLCMIEGEQFGSKVNTDTVGKMGYLQPREHSSWALTQTGVPEGLG